MLIGEGIKRVKTVYNKGVESQDSRLSNRYVYSKLKTVRTRLISQEIRKKNIVSDWTWQTIPCLPMIIAPTHECPCVPSKGCEILRSAEKLPAIFTSNDAHLIKSVSTIVGNIRFDKTTWLQVKNQSGNRYTSKLSEYFVHNGYLYITHNKALEVISLVALFEDPIEVEVYSQYCSKAISCASYLDYDLHIDGKLDESLIQLASEEILYIYSQMKEDDVNNQKDDTGSSIRHPSSYKYRDV